MANEEHIVTSPWENKLDQSGDLYQYIEGVFESSPDTVALVSDIAQLSQIRGCTLNL